jgi:tape measure domain-containing protein
MSTEGFDFELVADPSKANRAISEVERNLQKISQSAAVVSMRINDAIGGGSNNAARATNAWRTAASQLSDQLKRQTDMLNRINGPIDNHRADLAALDALYRMNKISASQYTEQLTRLNSELARSQGKGAAAAGGGGMGAMKKGAALIGVSVGAMQVGELANDYLNLENRLRYLAGGDLDKVNTMFQDMQRVAKATRSDVSATTEGFVRLSLATKDMGLTTQETTLLTERINKAIKLSGATSQEASAGMIQLSQGLASGALRGDELRSVMEQLPAVADVIAKSMGVTRGQLREMGKDGKITADVIVEAFRKAGPELDKAFGNTVPTLADHFVQFKNEMMVAFGTIVKNTGFLNIFGAALHVVGTVVKTVANFFELFSRAFGSMATKVAVGAAALGVAIKAGLGPIAAAAAVFEGAAWVGEKLGRVFSKAAIESQKLSAAIIAQSQAISEAAKESIKHSDAVHAMYLKSKLMDEGFVTAVTSARDLKDGIELVGAALQFLATGMDAGQAVLQEENKKLNEAREKTVAYAGAVDLLRIRMQELKDLGVADPFAMLSSGDVAAVRGLRDAQQDVLDLSGRYGEVVQSIHKKERERTRGIEDLKGALRTGEINQRQYNEAIKQFIPDAGRAAREAKRLRDEYARLAREIFGGNDKPKGKQFIDGEIAKAEITRIVDAEIAEEERAYNHAIDAMNRKLAAHEAWNEAVAKATDEAAEKRRKAEEEEVKRFEELMETRAQLIGELWAPVNNALVDMFKNGEFALNDFAREFEEVLTKMAIKIVMTSLLMGAFGMKGPMVNALGGDASLGKLLGFAQGGSFTVAGNGGTDSQVVAFRATPGERVSIETPRQQGGGGGGAAPMAASGPTIINNHFDRRALLPVLRSNGGRNEVLNIIRDNPGVVRALKRSR